MEKMNNTQVISKNVKARPALERVLAKGVYINNDLIVGPTRVGKTVGYIIPNLLCASESMIIADTKCNLYRQFGGYLAEKDYNVQCLDFKDIEKTPCGYNPLDYVRKTSNPRLIKRGDCYNEQDVKKIASIICPIQSLKDPFWDLAA